MVTKELKNGSWNPEFSLSNELLLHGSKKRLNFYTLVLIYSVIYLLSDHGLADLLFISERFLAIVILSQYLFTFLSSKIFFKYSS